MARKAWERLWALFHEALEKQPGERGAFLDQACGGDPDLHAEVDRMLAAHERENGLLDGEELAATRELPMPAEIGERYGPYSVLEILGEGGMGVVYAAVQQRPVKRKVALKVIRPGFDSREVVSRFEAERQALALMSHPAIAHVYDAGATADGRPYFAMELVDGEPITDYCDRERRGIRERLDLFLEICEGVHHAHQRGIIHRDLKPSNILVASRHGVPIPKIIDFGVAKATEQRLTERTLHTSLGVWVGTPEYMSPEQAEMGGLDIDTRSDVYSLGVLLYELLVGALPFDSKELRDARLDEIRRRIREVDPPRPSTRVSTLAGAASTEAATRRRTDVASLRRRLSGDLDWITMRALEKDRERRYESVAELAADIRRHLEDQPVLAGPPGFAYRARKFVRRHRMGVGLAALSVTFLLALVVTMAVQAGRIARERDRANQEAERATREAETARQVSDFLVGMFEVVDPSRSQGETVTAREILDLGAERVREELADRPSVQARMMNTIGSVYNKLGLFETGLVLQEEALGLRLELFGEQHLEVAESFVSMARSLTELGDFERARQLIERSLAIREALLGAEHAAVADSLYLRAWTDFRLGEYPKALESVERAVDIQQRTEDTPSTATAKMFTIHATILGELGRYEEGRRRAELALAILERAYGPDDARLASEVNALAILNWQIGDYERARPYFERALALYTRTHGPDHPQTSKMQNNLGRLLTDLGEYEQARLHLMRSLELSEQRFGPDHPETAFAVLNLGRLMGLTGELATAEGYYQRGIAIRETMLGPDHPYTAMALEGYGALLRSAGQETRAAEVEARAEAIRTQKGGHSPVAAQKESG